MKEQPSSEIREDLVDKDASDRVQPTVSTTESYTFEGKYFDVERVFREDAHDTIGTILLKLIWADAEG